jgi:hypothetical protein
LETALAGVARRNIAARCVSPPSVRARFAEQAGVTQGWHCYVGQLDHGIGLDHFGKVPGTPACLIHEIFSARQGVKDDDMNVICLGGRAVANTLAWELVRVFLQARFSGAERHRRRLAKVARLGSREAES